MARTLNNVTINTNDIRTLPVVSSHQPQSHKAALYMTPVSPCTNWITVHDDASDAATDTQTPGNMDVTSDPAMKVFHAGHAGTMLLLRNRYTPGATETKVKVIGFDGAYFENANNPVVNDMTLNVPPKPELLSDLNGNIEITLTIDAVNDVRDSAGKAYTQPVRIDYHGNLHMIFAVTQAGEGTLEARVI